MRDELAIQLTTPLHHLCIDCRCCEAGVMGFETTIDRQMSAFNQATLHP